MRRLAGCGRPLRTFALAPLLAAAAGCAVTTAPAPVTAPPALATAFRDAPPGRVSGGFGEDSCHACHFDQAPNSGTGDVALAGFPDRYTPGDTYELELAVSHTEMAAAGFQLTIRHADDMSQAGALHVPETEEGRVGILNEQGVLFAHQRLDGSEIESPGAVRWAIRWTAPDTPRKVVVHAAALAADGDESQLGDHVYTLEAFAEPQPASDGTAAGRGAPAGPR